MKFDQLTQAYDLSLSYVDPENCHVDSSFLFVCRFDKGVFEIDAAFNRRFVKRISLDHKPMTVALTENGEEESIKYMYFDAFIDSELEFLLEMKEPNEKALEIYSYYLQSFMRGR